MSTRANTPRPAKRQTRLSEEVRRTAQVIEQSRDIVRKAVNPHGALHDGKPLIHKATRIDERALNAVLAGMNMTDANKDRVRGVLVDGKSMREVASSDAVSPELVSATVRRVRAKLHGNLPPSTFVTASLTLPLVWAEELRGLSDLIHNMRNEALRATILKAVQKAITAAKTKALDDDE
jgi:DNA-binding CsgD family transcriptional regulator